MRALNFSALSLAVLFIQGCSSAQPPEPPPAKTALDPLLQTEERARNVQKTIDQGADNARRSIDSQERGDTSP